MGNEYYILIDGDGYCVVDNYYEGAFGCVIKVYHQDESQQFAMKIARLLADNSRENAYINNITESEKKVQR